VKLLLYNVVMVQEIEICCLLSYEAAVVMLSDPVSLVVETMSVFVCVCSCPSFPVRILSSLLPLSFVASTFLPFFA